MPEQPPIRREVTIAITPEAAFARFTDDISAWWPMDLMNVLGSASLVGFEDGRLVEGTIDGKEAVWGEVRDWEPGRRLVISWSPGVEAAQATEVTVSFSATSAGTQVVLEHDGWAALSDPAAQRRQYEQAWPAVLELYQRYASPEEEPGQTWVVLMHTPGPAPSTSPSVFDDPRFSGHVSFLEAMTERGYLMAAGPFGQDGSGMTILRLPGSGRLAEAHALATGEDPAVLSGLLAVDVRLWNVMFSTLD